MQLNGNEYSIQTISDKTNISPQNLEKIFNREWDKFKKAHVIGLISVIEREFKADLSELKEDAINYYNEHQEHQPDRPIDLVDAATVSGGSRVLYNILAFITIVAIAYAGWYYYTRNQKLNSPQELNSTDVNKTGMFEETIKSTKVVLDSSKKDESNKSNSSNIKVVSNTISRETAKKEPSNKFDITTNEQNISKNNSSQEETNTSAVEQEENITTQQIAEQNETNITTKENSTTTQNLNSDENISNEDNVTEVSNETAIEENSTIETTDTNTTEQNTTTAEDNTTIETLEVQNSINEVTFKLRTKRLWIGIYDLNSKKRVVVMAKKPYKLKIANEHKYAIVTGHGLFTLHSNNEDKKFSTKKKVYILITNNEIKEISKAEYRKITKKRAW